MCIPHNTHNIKMGGKVLDAGNLFEPEVFGKVLGGCPHEDF